MVSIFNFSECIEKRFSTDIIKKDFFSFVSNKGKKNTFRLENNFV